MPEDSNFVAICDTRKVYKNGKKEEGSESLREAQRPGKGGHGGIDCI